jgi:hypothetical protein
MALDMALIVFNVGLHLVVDMAFNVALVTLNVVLQARTQSSGVTWP